MIENINLHLLAGGRHHCSPDWNKTADALDQAFKVYFVFEGAAELHSDTGPHLLTAGHVYFVSGYQLKGQACADRMEKFWLHFVPESFLLRTLLNHMPTVFEWPAEPWDWARPLYQRLPELFDDPFSQRSRFRGQTSPLLTAQIEALLILLLTDMLGTHWDRMSETLLQGIQRLKPALDFMDERFKQNPPMAEVADTIALAPNYFHRMFTGIFGLSPFEYMEERRMNLARALLAGTAKPVKQVAVESGYDNPLYFSRVVTKHFGMSPRALRHLEKRT